MGCRVTKSRAADEGEQHEWAELPEGPPLNIVLAALDAFASKGYHATTTRDISTSAGLSPAALYVHFPSKLALLGHICIAGHRSVWNAVEAAGCAELEDPTDRLRCMLTVLVDWHAGHRRLAQVIQRELPALEGDVYAQVAALRTESEQLMRTRIRAAKVAAGVSTSQIKIETLACWSVIIDVSRWYHAPGPAAGAKFAERYAQLIMRMLDLPEAP